MTAPVPPKGSTRPEDRRPQAPPGLSSRALNALSDLAALAARACGVPAAFIRTPDTFFNGVASYGDLHAPGLSDVLVIPVTEDPEIFGLDTGICELVLRDRSPISLPPETLRLAE